jgi:hypothetical protein
LLASSLSDNCPAPSSSILSQWILDNDIDECCLGLTFVDELHEFGEVKEIELKPGGAEIEVTDENKVEYAELKAQFRLRRGVEEQTNAFMRGFKDILPQEAMNLFDERELEVRAFRERFRVLVIGPLRRWPRHV